MKLRYGNGSIIKRTRTNKNGSIYTYYQGKYYIGKEPKYITAKTQKECYAKLIQIKKEEKASSVCNANKYSLENWLTNYLNIYKPKIGKSTRKDYDSIIKNKIPAEVSKKDIKKIKAFELQEIVNRIFGKTQRRARTAYDLFRGAFKQAAINELVRKDITEGIIKPVQDNAEEETPLNQEQQKQIYALPPSLIKDILIAYIWTGCRRNELLTLEKTFYNRAEQTLYINGTKNKHAKGTIPVFEPLREVLERQSAIGKFIFDISLSTLKRYKEKIEESLGWTFTFKALRHTFSQNLHDMEIDDITRAAWMRHSKPTTTKRVYTHFTEELKQKAIEKIKSITKK